MPEEGAPSRDPAHLRMNVFRPQLHVPRVSETHYCWMARIRRTLRRKRGQLEDMKRDGGSQGGAEREGGGSGEATIEERADSGCDGEEGFRQEGW